MWSTFLKSVLNAVGIDAIHWAVCRIGEWFKDRSTEKESDKKHDCNSKEVAHIRHLIKRLRDQPKSKDRDEKIKEAELRLRAALMSQHSSK